MARYAESLARPDFKAQTEAQGLNERRIKACQSERFRWALVVPAFDEPAGFLQAIVQNISFPNQRRGLLVICVVNAPQDATPQQRSRTKETLPPPEELDPQDLGRGIHALFIDAVTDPLATDKATGLARKLGNDIACRLLSAGHIKAPVLCNTDADAVLPRDYFTRLSKLIDKPYTALIMPFAHRSDTVALHEAGIVYELYLRSLQFNLARAGSPYAYPALGSVLAIGPDAYARTRGFPQRRAGEDFYLLNKLAKLGEVHYLTGEPVMLAARTSHRVPFGTGPMLAKLLAQSNGGKMQMQTYSLASFTLLTQFYRGFSELRATAQRGAQPDLPTRWRDPDLLWLLKQLGLPGALERLQKNHRTETHLRRALHEWFDALKTVRFLNEARHFHPDEPLLEQLSHLSKSSAPGFSKPAADTAGHTADKTASETNRALECRRLTSRHGVTTSTD